MAGHPFQMPGLKPEQIRQVIQHVEAQISAYTKIQEGLRNYQSLTVSTAAQGATKDLALGKICGGLDILLRTYVGERQVYLDMQKKLLAQMESGIVMPLGSHPAA